jgi:hypothetical protein
MPLIALVTGGGNRYAALNPAEIGAHSSIDQIVAFLEALMTFCLLRDLNSCLPTNGILFQRTAVISS